jgi:hypothetical protein
VTRSYCSFSGVDAGVLHGDNELKHIRKDVKIRHVDVFLYTYKYCIPGLFIWYVDDILIEHTPLYKQ